MRRAASESGGPNSRAHPPRVSAAIADGRAPVSFTPRRSAQARGPAAVDAAVELRANRGAAAPAGGETPAHPPPDLRPPALKPLGRVGPCRRVEWTPEADRALRAAALGGAGWAPTLTGRLKLVAAAFGVSVHLLEKRLSPEDRQAAVRAGMGRWREDEQRALLDGLAAGLSVSAIARALGRPVSTVARRVQRRAVAASVAPSRARGEYSKPALPTDLARERPCLRCGHLMLSEHPGVRHCGRCRIWMANQP